MSAKRVALVLLACAVAAVVALGGYLLYDDSAHNSRFDAVTAGMTESDVVRILGRPDERRQGCRDAPSWEGAPVAGACAVQLVYYAHLGPVFWTVGFDRNGKAIAKYAYVSP